MLTDLVHLKLWIILLKLSFITLTSYSLKPLIFLDRASWYPIPTSD